MCQSKASKVSNGTCCVVTESAELMLGGREPKELGVRDKCETYGTVPMRTPPVITVDPFSDGV